MELNEILKKFAESGWDLISAPSEKWLNGGKNRDELKSAIKNADEVCGNCGCELDHLYKRALELL